MMQPMRPFQLERFFAKWEFAAPHLLCCSDAQPLALKELLEGGEFADADASRRWAALRLGYTESQGLPALREAIALELYGGGGDAGGGDAGAGAGDGDVPPLPPLPPLAADDVVVCAPQEGILLALQALVGGGNGGGNGSSSNSSSEGSSSGGAVLVTVPGYQSLTEVAAAAGARVLPWAPRGLGGGGGENDGSSGRSGGGSGVAFDVDDALDVISRGAAGAGPRVGLLVFNFPHNPTGATLAPADYVRLLAGCRAHGVRVLSDEMYSHLSAAPLPPAALLYEGAVSLCGLSKSWGLAGLRLGWLLAREGDPGGVLRRVLQLKDYTTICAPAPCEVLALAAVRAWRPLTERCRAVVARNLGPAAAFFGGRWAHVFDYSPPAAGPVAFPRVKKTAAGGGDASDGDVERWCEALATEAGVLLLPGSVYVAARGAAGEELVPQEAARHVRLGLGREDFPACLQALDAWLVGRYGEPGDLTAA